MDSSAIRPFTPSIPSDVIADLIQRLKQTRLPEAETVEDWSQGVPLSYQAELLNYWANDYDFDRIEQRLGAFDNFVTDIDGIDIHFIHKRSQHTAATPLLITHGWPGSVLEYLDILDALTDPTQHGGSPDDAFHVVLPALPGFGFSSKPRDTGTGVPKIAALWETLMHRLNYTAFHAHGGDWGSIVTQAVLLQEETACTAGHCTLPIVLPDETTLSDPQPSELDALESFQFYNDWDSGYSKQQSTRPQTLGYGLADSPSGQMAWIVEKFAFWMDCERNGVRHPENVLTKDQLLDNVTLYWATNSAASSARLYWESFNTPNLNPISRPMALSVFPKEIMRTSERWARGRFHDLVHFNNQFERGGHFAALEVPDILVSELRTWRSKAR
ncbi:MAG: epoxide hydrolase [Luminiphilus sp.]|nr:epoxide hydrolase [Luminiphilus sp.]